MTDQIHWINALSQRISLESAINEVVETVSDSIKGEADLAIVFIASAFASEYSRLVPLLLEKLPVKVLIGCGGGGIIGTNRHNEVVEVEVSSALSLSVAQLPGVEIFPFHLLAEELPDLDSSPDSWYQLIGVKPEQKPQFILLADPFSSKINDLIAGLDFAYPGSVSIGGLASAEAMNVPQGLFYYRKNAQGKYLRREGTVGVALCGNIQFETIVAQGCRAIGDLCQVTKGERNIIVELATIKNDHESYSRPSLDVLRGFIDKLSERDRALAQNSLFVGIARDEFQMELGQGDFLIRNLLGVDPRSGAIAIGDRIRPGQRIQFHLRDAHTSAEDLEMLLRKYHQLQDSDTNNIGALMFSCLGRGQGLYGKPNVDSELLRRYLPNIPLGGFFCNGEIGPVGGSTFLHGYTSAFAIIKAKDHR